MEILSSEYKSSSSSIIEEDEVSSGSFPLKTCQDISLSSDKTPYPSDVKPTNSKVSNIDTVQRALQIINNSVSRKANNIVKDNEQENERLECKQENQISEMTESPPVVKTNEGKDELVENLPQEKIIETKNAELPSSGNNGTEKDHNCIENILGKPPVVTTEDPKSVFDVPAKPQTSASGSVDEFRKNITNSKQGMSVHRGKPLGFGEIEISEDNDNVKDDIQRLGGSSAMNNKGFKNRSNSADDEKGGRKENQKVIIDEEHDQLDTKFWTGFDDDSYHYIRNNQADFGVAHPQPICPPALITNKDVPKVEHISGTQKKHVRGSESNKAIRDKYTHNDAAASPVANTESNQHISVVPKVAVRIKNGVAKSVVEARWMEIEAFINDGNHKKRNWRSLVVPPFLSDIIDSVCIGCTKIDDGADLTKALVSTKVKLTDLHLYRPNSDGPLSQNLSLDPNSDESAVGSQLWNLPCIEFENIWQNLFYSDNLKNEVLSYVYSLVKLSESGVNTNIITVHRMIMLLGPPGTGKTSLCRGLAQLLSIQLNDIYPQSVMVEINSHSLFSKWFSESGKLVQKMFDHIDDLAEDEKCMVFVLIDEVESLGMCRNNSSKRGDPADSIRAVNALITQIDRIRRRKNVLIMCTSNLEKCLDSALVDRVDFVRHVGQPSQLAIYTIIYDVVNELQRIGIVDRSSSLAAPWEIGDKYHDQSSILWTISSEAAGLSGRALRQIPALVYAMTQKNVMSLDECLKNFRKAIQERRCRKSI